jgi:hypothetical protein
MSKEYKVVINASFGGFRLSDQALAMLVERKGFEDNGFIHGWLPRHDPDLVAVVEELGEAAGASRSKLVVETIISPLYEIREYDGSEDVYTPENIQWIQIE